MRMCRQLLHFWCVYSLVLSIAFPDFCDGVRCCFGFAWRRAGAGCRKQDAGVRPVKADQAAGGLQPRVRRRGMYDQRSFYFLSVLTPSSLGPGELCPNYRRARFARRHIVVRFCRWQHSNLEFVLHIYVNKRSDRALVVGYRTDTHTPICRSTSSSCCSPEHTAVMLTHDSLSDVHTPCLLSILKPTALRILCSYYDPPTNQRRFFIR